MDKQTLLDEQAQLGARYRQLRDLRGDLQAQLAECERQIGQMEGALGLLHRLLHAVELAPAANAGGEGSDGQA